MNPRFRRQYITILLLCVITYQSTGYVIMYALWMMDAKQAMRRTLMQQIPGAQLSQFVFVDGMVVQGDSRVPIRINDDEFECNGEMYDIVRSATHGDSTVVMALADTRESTVRRSLSESINRRAEDDPAAARTHQVYMDLKNIRYILHVQHEQECGSVAVQFPPYTELGPLSPLRSIELPPPEPSDLHS